MVGPNSHFHEEFRPERVEREIRLISPGLLVGENPAAFARELMTMWEFGTRRSFDPFRSVFMIVRDDLPENLRSGFGLHFGAVMTSASRIPTMLNSKDQLQSFYEDRLLDARLCQGEFAKLKKAS